MIDPTEFKLFAESLSPSQIMSVQQILKPTQLPTVFQIVGAVRAGNPIDVDLVKTFLLSIDDEQTKKFARILTGKQNSMLTTAISNAKTTS